MPAYYSNSISQFLKEESSSILGKITSESSSAGFYQQLASTTKSYEEFIDLLKTALLPINNSLPDSSGILLEYPIPRRNKRIDCILIINDIIIVIEAKTGATSYNHADKIQLEDYCLDLRDFHQESNGKVIVPILCATKANNTNNDLDASDGIVKETMLANSENLCSVITAAINRYSTKLSAINFHEWDRSAYLPTPTIVEAAQSLYSGHAIREITHSHAGAVNLTKTTETVIKAITEARNNNSKIICFITGVPGAGKTLAGLNIIHNKSYTDDEKELGVFLSGNSPLIKVLREALARDSKIRNNSTLEEERRKVSTFIQNVHQFIDEYYDNKKVPPDRVVVFDEAQRAWNAEQSNRKFERDFSEAELMFDIMSRHEGWAAIIALIGGGQEINSGEAGLPEWGKTLVEKNTDWKIYISPELLSGDHSTANQTLFDSVPSQLDINTHESLHLNVSIRAYRANELSKFVGLLLLNQPSEAKKILTDSLSNYPIVITRSLETSKKWLESKQKGYRRIGLVATSGARRLRPFGLDVKAELKEAEWLLNPKGDVRSSYALEVPATEFSIQGLELDWVGLCWDGDLRRKGNEWQFKQFTGTKWNDANKDEKKSYILNKYRVLLTRAREGMIIWIPNGDATDKTRPQMMYDDIYEYLKSCGIKSID
jgi:hypothetical protein